MVLWDWCGDMIWYYGLFFESRCLFSMEYISILRVVLLINVREVKM